MGYKVFVSTFGQAWQVQTYDTNSALGTFTATGLLPSTGYAFEVAPVTNDPFIGQKSARTPYVMTPSANVFGPVTVTSITNVASNSLTLSWTAPSPAGTGSVSSCVCLRLCVILFIRVCLCVGCWFCGVFGGFRQLSVQRLDSNHGQQHTVNICHRADCWCFVPVQSGCDQRCKWPGCAERTQRKRDDAVYAAVCLSVPHRAVQARQRSLPLLLLACCPSPLFL